MRCKSKTDQDQSELVKKSDAKDYSFLSRF